MSGSDPARPLPGGWTLPILGVLLALALLLEPASPFVASGGYVAGHTALEVVGIVVAGMCFGVVWAARRPDTPLNTLVLATAFLGVAVLDFMHMVSFTGMPDFVSPSGVEKSIFFWLVPRGLAAAALLWAAFRPWQATADARGLRVLQAAVAALVAVTAWLGLWQLEWLPHTWIPAQGLTPLKVGTECVTVAVFALAAWGFWRGPARAVTAVDPRHLAAAAAVMALSGTCFTLYTAISDIFSFLGHGMKVVAYYYLFRGLFEATVLRPYQRLDQANARLLEADRYKDEFLSVVSHELRTPLNFITGFASILDDELHGPLNPLQHASTGKILAGADRMLMLVDDLLDFARLQAGALKIAPEPTPYGPLVAETLASLAPLAAAKSLELVASIEPGLVPVLDGGRIAQVLTNLVGNAIKFTPAGSVAVRAWREGDRLVTEVSDTGIGIAAEHQATLFERFKQVDMSATRTANGFGLGLAIVKALVEAHGGAISLDSTPGVGTVCRFELPLGAHENGPPGGGPFAGTLG